MAFIDRKKPFVPPERTRVGAQRQTRVPVTFACCGTTRMYDTDVKVTYPARCPNQCPR